MWAEKRKDGYKFTERYTDPLTGQIRRVSVTMEKNTAKAQKKAQELLSERIEALTHRTDIISDNCTLSDLVEEYRKYQKDNAAQSTYQRNYHTMNTLMKLLGKDTLVDKLTARYVRSALASTKKDGGTLNEYIRRFKAMLRWGYKNDMVDNIAFIDKIEPFKDAPHRVKIQEKYLEGNELRAVLAEMGSRRWELATKFLALSGLRFGEFCALKSKDVDLEQCQIHITKSYDSANEHEVYVKNNPSYRDVHIQPELLTVCKEIDALTKRIKFKYNIQSDLFLCEKDGGHVDYFAFNKYLKEHALKVTGKHITTHALRHTHASLLFEQGFTMDEVARRLGHGNSKITREIYVHVTDRLKERDNAKLDKISLL